MNEEEISYWRHKCAEMMVLLRGCFGMSRREFAGFLDLSPQLIAKYETAAASPPGYVLTKIFFLLEKHKDSVLKPCLNAIKESNAPYGSEMCESSGVQSFCPLRGGLAEADRRETERTDF